MDPRTIIIGDIHGAFKALEQVLDRCKYRVGIDTLVCIGDYVDGWPESFRVCDYLLDLRFEARQRGSADVILIKGNHDDWVKDILDHDLERLPEADYIRNRHSHWFYQGGEATYKSFVSATPGELELLRDHFFKHLKLYHHDEVRNIVYVHGGWDPAVGFDLTKNTKPVDFMWDRNLYSRAKHLWDLKNKYGESGPKKSTINLDNFNRIYIGHTCTVSDDILEPVIMGNLVNVDQGAGFYGRLTAYIHETDTYVQSDRVMDLYPNSRGR